MHTSIKSNKYPRVLWKPMVLYRIHKCLSRVSIPSQTNRVHTQDHISWRSILKLSSHLRLGLSSCHFPAGSATTTLYKPLPAPIRVTCPALLIFDLLPRIIFSEQYRSLSSSLCSFLQTVPRFTVTVTSFYSTTTVRPFPYTECAQNSQMPNNTLCRPVMPNFTRIGQ
jgi:hypothetical protein